VFQLPHDSYGTFVFVADEAHRSSRTYHGIEVKVTYRPKEWQWDWDDYDLAAMQLAEWSRSFGD
jgi:hypothetical protein